MAERWVGWDGQKFGSALDPEEIQRRRKQLAQEREERDRLWIEEDAATSESVDVPTDNNHVYGVDPATADYSGWTPGNHGKGHFIDGVPYTWNTNKAGGPEHMHHLKYQTDYPPEISFWPEEYWPEGFKDTEYNKIYINPDGTLWWSDMLTPEQLEVLKGMGHVPQEEKQRDTPSQFGHGKNVMDILNRTSGFWDEPNPEQTSMTVCPSCGNANPHELRAIEDEITSHIGCLGCGMLSVKQHKYDDDYHYSPLNENWRSFIADNPSDMLRG